MTSEGSIRQDETLEALRDRIDSIDGEILDCLARRNAVVAEIARFKRDHGVAIRDRRRERRLIAERRQRAGELGLRADVLESLYRLILWASRDRQAALKAEVPLNTRPRRVAIIGGHGGMGRCLAGLFGDLGHEIRIADLDTDLTPIEAAAASEVVVISVPIDVTVKMIEQVGPHVRPDGLLLDVTSIKTAPVRAMLEATTASVIGTHPLFGPGVHSLQGQRIVITPGRGDEWRRWLETMLRARGLTLKHATPEDHDRAMAVVQVLTHFATEVWGDALARFGVPIDQTLEYTSPVYMMELLMTGRHFAQSPALYADIQMSNPLRREVTDAFVESATALRTIVDRGDHDGFEALFGRVREHFGPFTDRALEQSSFLIDRLVERME